MKKTYSELSKLPTFEERLAYLKLDGSVGDATFGSNRPLNQDFYRSPEWRKVRDQIIVRDGCCDLGVPDREIHGRVLIHHLNPITEEQILDRDPALLDPENLVAVTFDTHNMIHYGDERKMIPLVAQRKPGDTCPWKIHI